MKTFIFIFLCTLLIISCKTYSQNHKEEIIDPILSASTFRFEYNSNVILPDSLGGHAYKGFALLNGIINDSLKLDNIQITRLFLFTLNKDTIFNYYGWQNKLPHTYPPKIKDYLPFFEDCIKSVKIIKTDKNVDKRRYTATIVLQFK
ncbi:hypothetical protein [Microbacter margulisiae]|uniref:Uncharacterized protein n=1 Tax=Microbacter margulisiae TaxID=1350067 RepID=A0A7W5H1Q8_9PORP|nr:hypothetical protein [Microbacter margulisiae]MBB3187863.1 hypothetical protein [Microbacter margulisiae]